MLEPIEILSLPKATRSKQIQHPPEESTNTFAQNAAVLAMCAVGLQVSYLTWGVLQERLITIDYDGEKFQSSQFLVFSNRTIAFCVAIFINTFITKATRFAPFHKYAFASFSNIMSSWCQYEALKYVSFPTQVVSKSSKLIPVMIMGKILADKTYKKYEYVVAGVISLGVIIFTLSQESKKAGDDDDNTAFGGVLLLLGYISFDSFTSQWQGKVFKDYKVSPYQMMLGVNFFSASCTLISLTLSGEIFSALQFISSHPSSLSHIVMLSVCGATGQLFIFYTIKRFGPLVFTMIMTTRQLVSIILSCFIYSHTINSQGYVGAAIVFAALGYRIKRRHDASKKRGSVRGGGYKNSEGSRAVYTSVSTRSDGR